MHHCSTCHQLGHKAPSHSPRAAHIEHEGPTVRITCHCGARIAGQFDEEQVAEILAAHRHGVRARTNVALGAQTEMEQPNDQRI